MRKTSKRAAPASTKKKCVTEVLQMSMDDNITSAIGDHEVIDLDDISPTSTGMPSIRGRGKRRLRSTHPEPFSSTPQSVSNFYKTLIHRAIKVIKTS